MLFPTQLFVILLYSDTNDILFLYIELYEMCTNIILWILYLCQ